MKEGKVQVSVHHEGKHDAPALEARAVTAVVKPTVKPQPKTSHTGPRPFRGQARGS